MRAASMRKKVYSYHSQRLSHDHYVHEPLVAVSRRNPDAIAAIALDAEGFDCKSISYGKLASRARNLAARLVPHLRNRPGASVGVLLNRDVDCLVAATACSMAGAAYVPMDEKYPRERLEYIAKDAQCVALIVADGAEGRQLVDELLPSFSNPVVVASADEDDSPASAEALLNAPRMAPTQAPAYIMYTSGSTGLPKGVMMSHRSLNACLSAFLREVGMPSRGVLMSTPSGFDINLFEIWGALLTGTTALVPTHIEMDERWFRSTAKAMNRHGCSFVHGVPAVLHGLFAAGWSAGSDASVVSCGEVFPVPLANALRQRVGRLFNGYGPTETHYCTTYRVPSSSLALGRSVPIGKPLSSATVRVERTDGSACKVGEDGELVVGGDTVALGYLNRPVETQERFIEREGRRMYRTGDIVRLMPDGNLDYVGRRDQQLNAGGLRVEAAECERPLVEHPLVQEAVVVETGGVLRAYVTLRRRGGIDAASLARWLVPRLPFYHIPRCWEFLEQLPRTSTQKIDRQALMMRDVSRTTTVPEEDLRRDR